MINVAILHFMISIIQIWKYFLEQFMNKWDHMIFTLIGVYYQKAKYQLDLMWMQVPFELEIIFGSSVEIKIVVIVPAGTWTSIHIKGFALGILHTGLIS